MFALLAAVCFFLQGFNVKWSDHSWVWIGVGLLCIHLALAITVPFNGMVQRLRG